MHEIAENIRKVKGAVCKAAKKANRNPDKIKLVAVSKTVDSNKIREAFEAGQNVFGENRIQEAINKIATLPASIQWHMVGHLQSNKVKHVLGQFELIHSVDSLLLAEAIQKKAESIEKVVDVLIQINTSGEKTKFGVHFDEAVTVIKSINKLKNLRVKGLMTIPPYSVEPEDSRYFFRKLKSVKIKLVAENINIQELSMGMSNDYEVAVEEGATLIRVGTAIFGSRT